MSSTTWQTIVIALVIGAALAYLIRSVIRRHKAAAHCANCPAVKATQRH